MNNKENVNEHNNKEENKENIANINTNINMTNEIDITKETKETNETNITNKIRNSNNIFFKNYKKHIINFLTCLSTFLYFVLWFYGLSPYLKDVIINVPYLKNMDKLSLLVISSTIFYLLGILVPYLIYKYALKFKINICFNIKEKNKRNILLNNLFVSLLMGVFIQPIGMGASGIATLLTGGNTAVDALSIIDKADHILLASFIYALAPGILEELVFRGVIFSTCKKYYNVITSSIFSAICFGIMHMNLQQFIYATVIGTILAFIYEKTKNILDVIIIHFLIDFSQMYLVLSVIKYKNLLNESAEGEANIGNPLIVLTACLLLILPFAFICKKLYDKYKPCENEQYEEIID